MEKRKKYEYIVISLIPIVMLIYSFFSIDFNDLIKNMTKIFISNDVLLTDYFIVAGREAAMFNASLIALLNIFLLYKFDMKINGLVIAGIYIMFGFSFMGKNLFNIIPFYIGGFFYSKFINKPFKSVIIVTMFSTALSPFVSVIAGLFGFSPLGYFYAFLLGIILGFIVPPVSAHTVQFHSGYSLYNTGLAVGLIAIIAYSVMRAYKVLLTSNKIHSETMDYPILIILCISFTFFIVYGFILNGYSFKGLNELLKHSGRMVSDFTVTEGFPIVIINMGMLGFLCLIFVFTFFPILNGPILGGIFTVLSFAGFGKHIKNCLPVMIGVVIAYYFTHSGISISAFAITVFFGTTLAPISGKFGFVAGILSGFLVFCLVSNIGPAHGGLNLYNTGLSGGIIASVLVPILRLFKEE